MSTYVDEKLKKPVTTESARARASLKYLATRHRYCVLEEDAAGPLRVSICPMDETTVWRRVGGGGTEAAMELVEGSSEVEPRNTTSEPRAQEVAAQKPIARETKGPVPMTRSSFSGRTPQKQTTTKRRKATP